MEYRYRDKAYLSTYTLDTKVFDNFNFVVEDATPLRSVYILTTNEGFKIFKKIDYSKAELIFIYEALNIIRNKYPYIINFKKNVFQKPYIEFKNEIYVVLDLIEGRECLFENPVDLKNTAAALSNYHVAARNIKLNTSVRNNSGKMAARYKHRITDMENYKKIALMHVNKSEFDRLYLEYVDYYIDCAKDALNQILKSSYKELCETKKVLCHHDLAHHNIIIGNDNNIYFVDFDYAIIDLPYHDISNLITKAAKSNGWRSDILDTILEAYLDINNFNMKEMEVLFGYLLFPLDFYEVATGYYMRTKKWDEDDFTEKLRRKAGYKEDRESFLEYFNEKWRVKID